MLKNTMSKLNAGSTFWYLLTDINSLFKSRGFGKISNNVEYKNKYLGKRCFIIGNGPSLKDVDPKLLENEYTITVNSIVGSDFFNAINPIFHIFADKNFFEGFVSKDFDNYLKIISSKGNTTVCVPAQYGKFMKEHSENININVFYYKSFSFFKEINKIDFSKCIPGFNKVIHYAICLAVYLGFSEINLLGCDETGVETTINLILSGDSKNDHCYEDSNEIKQVWIDELKTFGLKWFFDDQALVFFNYEKIARYCKNNGVSLFNLSSRSLIDSIEKKSLSDVIWEKKN